MNRLQLMAAFGGGLLLAAAFPALVFAQDGCSGSAPPVGCPALMAHALTQSFIQGRLDRSNSTSPDARIDARLNGRAWNPAANGAAPITLAPNGGTTDFGTSLSRWGSWQVRTDAETIEAAKPLLKEGMSAPAPVPIGNRQVDVWTTTRVSPLTDSTGEAAGKAYTSYLGADYALRPGLLVGGMVQVDSAEQDGAVPGGSASGQGFMAGPYMAMKLTPNVTFDARAAVGQAEDSVSVAGAANDLETTRRQARAQLKGDWSWSSWHLTPHAAIESTGETASGLAGEEASAGSERISVGPRISKQVDLGKGTTIEPFVHMRTSADVDKAGALVGGSESVDPHRTLGAGLNLRQTEEFSFEATADLDDPGNGADKELRSGVKLKIPLQ